MQTLGIIIGAAGAGIASSLVANLINPFIRLILGGVNFSGIFLDLSGNNTASFAAAKRCGAAVFAYGRPYPGHHQFFDHRLCAIHADQGREQVKGSPGKGGRGNFWPNSRRSGDLNPRDVAQVNATSREGRSAQSGGFMRQAICARQSGPDHPAAAHYGYLSGTECARPCAETPAVHNMQSMRFAGL